MNVLEELQSLKAEAEQQVLKALKAEAAENADTVGSATEEGSGGSARGSVLGDGFAFSATSTRSNAALASGCFGTASSAFRHWLFARRNSR